jgi:hypothetical protein
VWWVMEEVVVVGGWSGRQGRHAVNRRTIYKRGLGWAGLGYLVRSVQAVVPWGKGGKNRQIRPTPGRWGLNLQHLSAGEHAEALVAGNEHPRWTARHKDSWGC